MVNQLEPDDSVNLAAVAADDALLNDPAGHDGVLPVLLARWRAEVDAEPHREMVDTDTALAILAAHRTPDQREGVGAAGWTLLAVLAVLAVLGVWIAAH